MAEREAWNRRAMRPEGIDVSVSPLPVDEVSRTADLVWRYLSSGRNLGRKNPLENEAVRGVIERSFRAIGQERKLRFNVIWGGFKDTGDGSAYADAADESTFKHMADEFKGLREKFNVPVEVNILFCNVHTILNGRNFEDSRKYLDEGPLGGISALAAKYGLGVIPLNMVYMRSFWGQRGDSFDGIMNSGKTSGDADFREYINRVGSGETGAMANMLDAAGKHSVFVKSAAGDLGVSKRSAATYFAWRKFEARLLSEGFPDSIFISFSDPSAAEIQPKASVFWWALKRGDGSVPWFANNNRTV